MDVVWSQAPVTVRDVVRELPGRRRPAYTTVMTVMNRLVDKGLLRRRPQGQSYRYSATKTETEFLRGASRLAIDQYLRTFGDLAIVQFLDVLEEVDPKKIEALRKKFHPKG